MMSSIRLPTHMDAIMPQNRVGFLVITWGPGMMPWIVIAPTIRAITALGGIPKVNSGMNEVCAPALLALSGPATPSIAPRPKRLGDRKSTRLNSSHANISYAVFCLKKKKHHHALHQ